MSQVIVDAEYGPWKAIRAGGSHNTWDVVHESRGFVDILWKSHHEGFFVVPTDGVPGAPRCYARSLNEALVLFAGIKGV